MLKKIFLFIISFLYFIFYILYFNAPYVGPYGHSHLQFSIAARNYLEAGWQKFIPYIWPSQVYLNHPPLLYILLAIFYRIFGFHDWAGRLMPLLFSFFGGLFFYLIVKKYFGKKIALYSLLFYLTFPMFLFYGTFIQFEPLVLFFCLGSFHFLDGFLEKKQILNLLLSVICYLLSVMSDWSGLIFGILIIIYLIIKKRRFLALYFFILNTLYLILYTRFLSSIGFSLSSLLSAYFSRATLKEVLNINFLLRFISIIFLRFIIYFSPLIIFFVLHLSSFIPQFKLKNQEILWIFIIFLLFPITNILLLPGGTLTHPYFLFFFIPIIAVSLARGRLARLAVFHLIWSLIIFSLKIYQIKKFSWQYQVVRKTAKVIGEDKIFYKNWALDKELFYWYDKKIPMEIYPPELLTLKKYQADYYLFICFPQCQKSDHQFLKNLSKRFSWQRIDIKIPSYIFNLKEKPKKEKIIVIKEEIKADKYLIFLRKVKSIFGIEQI